MRQHVVAGEQQPVPGVGEDDVALGVARGRHHPQGPGGQLDLLVGGQPLIRLLPAARPAARRGAERPQPLDHHPGAARPQLPELRLERPGVLGQDRPDGRVLARAQAHLAAEDPAQLHRLRVVVAVHVGDEEVPHVAEPAAERGQRGRQCLLGLGQRPSAVDEDEPVAVLQDVDVHRPQAVGGQGKRHPVHAGGDGEQARIGPAGGGRAVRAHVRPFC